MAWSESENPMKFRITYHEFGFQANPQYDVSPRDASTLKIETVAINRVSRREFSRHYGVVDRTLTPRGWWFCTESGRPRKNQEISPKIRHRKRQSLSNFFGFENSRKAKGVVSRYIFLLLSFATKPQNCVFLCGRAATKNPYINTPRYNSEEFYVWYFREIVYKEMNIIQNQVERMKLTSRFWFLFLYNFAMILTPEIPP